MKKRVIVIAIILTILAIISAIYFSKSNFFNDKINTLETVYNTSLTENVVENIINSTHATNTTNTTNTNTSTNTNNVANSTEIFQKHYAKAEKLLKTMSLEEKVGQMFLVRYLESGAVNEVKSYSPGGYILFGRDFEGETKESILKQINNCQNASKIKMLFGVDEEGGTVVRVSAYKAFRSSKFKSPQEIWKQGQLPAILKDSNEKSALLKSIGLNMNLTPVADVPTKSSSFIYKRSYGRGAQKTATYVASLIKTMNEDNMISTMKHFPGYGDNVDTHTGIAVDNRPYSTFENSDFLPFKTGIEAGAPTILVNHNIVNCMDKDLPASLSKKVHDILRNELKFSGLIITDDLAMDAVKSYVENGEAAVQAVLAGNDMIISSDFKTQRDEVLNAVKNGKISEELIDNAVKRILACKYEYGIIN